MAFTLIVAGLIAFIFGSIGVFFKYALGKYVLIPAILAILGLIAGFTGAWIEANKLKTSIIKIKDSRALKTSKTSGLIALGLIIFGITFILILFLAPKFYYLPMILFSSLFVFAMVRTIWLHVKHPEFLKIDHEVEIDKLEKYRKEVKNFKPVLEFQNYKRTIKLRDGKEPDEAVVKKLAQSLLAPVSIILLILLIMGVFKPAAFLLLIPVLLFIGLIFYIRSISVKGQKELLKHGEAVLGLIVQDELSLGPTDSSQSSRLITVYYEVNGFPYSKHVSIPFEQYNELKDRKPNLLTVEKTVILLVSKTKPKNALVYELSDYEVVI